MRAGANPDVRRLIDQEVANIHRVATAFPARFNTARETIGALLALLGLRQRTFALIGEHFSVFSFDGIVAMDTLDETLLARGADILSRRPDVTPDATAEASLQEAFSTIKPSREHPVGYEILFLSRRMFEEFDGFLESRPDLDDEEDREKYEHSFLKRLALAIGGFVNDRQTPIARHFSDVQREHLVVERLHCACGLAQFKVSHQSLLHDPAGGMVDRLEVKCTSCGAKESLEFPLPFIGDLTIA